MKTQIITTLVGLWIMVAPGVLSFSTVAADNGHIIGPIIVTFSFVALWEATHGMRRWNYPFALWLLLAPWVLGYESTAAIVSDMASGAAVIILSSLKHNIKTTFGGGWKSLFEKKPLHLQKAQEQ